MIISGFSFVVMHSAAKFLSDLINIDFVELARLLIRYQDFKGAEDLNSDIEKLLNKWNINREKLEEKTRKIWSEGFRPNSSTGSDNVGSGFDTSDSSQD